MIISPLERVIFVSRFPGFGPMLYYPDPEFEYFPPPGGADGKKFDKEQKLLIKVLLKFY